jgi:catechol 2,3-dioxygenase-like lactoylglutathione lyase family enzyme
MQLSKPELDVGLSTRGAEKLHAFYRDLLGLLPLPPLAMGELGSQLRLRVGGHVLKIYDFAEPPEPCEGGTEKAIGMRLLAFVLDDLPAVLARFDAAGHPYRELPVPEGTPYRVAFANDADGNALELVGLRRPAGEQLTTRLQVGLTVSDIERSRHFYGEVLGLPEQPPMKLPASMGVTGNVRYGFTAGGSTIKFWNRGELPVRTGAPGKRTGIRLMTAFVEDVDATHALLQSRGAAIKVAPHDLAGLARVMFVADPDGNWIEFAKPR